MKIKFNVTKNLQAKNTFKKFKNVLFKSMLKMHELAVMRCPVDTSRLRNSININPSVPGFANYTLFDGVEYGIDIEYGTDPHYVNAENLTGWAGRVLKNKNAAYAVAKSIARKGTEAQPFFRPAFDEVKNIWVKRYFNEVLKKDNNL